MSNHTKEPWRYELNESPDGHSNLECTIFDMENSEVAYTICEEDAFRIVACVNACAGMADPEKEIAEMRTTIWTKSMYIDDLLAKIAERDAKIERIQSGLLTAIQNMMHARAGMQINAPERIFLNSAVAEAEKIVYCNEVQQ